MSFDEWAVNNQNFKALSQSLWNRAMSFDVKRAETLDVDLPVSIPLEQGNVFRLQWGVRALCGKASQSHFPTFSDV